MEMGAQWVQGEKGNVIHEMALPHGLLDTKPSVMPNMTFFEANGEIVPPDESTTAFKRFGEISDQVGSNGEEIAPLTPWGTYFKAK